MKREIGGIRELNYLRSNPLSTHLNTFSLLLPL